MLCKSGLGQGVLGSKSEKNYLFLPPHPPRPACRTGWPENSEWREDKLITPELHCSNPPASPESRSSGRWRAGTPFGRSP